jgi:uncharacterized protein YcgI (DUF1989 family)
MNLTTSIISPGSSQIYSVAAGDMIRIIDIEGRQVADVCFVLDEDREEGMSGIVTSQMNGTVYLTTGHRLFTGRSRAAFTITGDSVGTHDLLMGACSKGSYFERYGAVDHPNCHDLLTSAFASAGVDRIVGDTFNAFQNAPVAADGSLSIQIPRSGPQDYVDLRAEVDALVAITACPADLSACNDYNPTAIGVEVTQEAPSFSS